MAAAVVAAAVVAAALVAAAGGTRFYRGIHREIINDNNNDRNHLGPVFSMREHDGDIFYLSQLRLLG